MRTTFVALVPVKPLDRGKSRLVGVPDDVRRALALAFARDTLAAVRSAPGIAEVVVVSDDAEIASYAAERGHRVTPDAGDLNTSLRRAADSSRVRAPGARPVAVCADLPGLSAEELGRALLAMEGPGAWFVADHLGVGTTAYAAAAPVFDPRFGPESRSAHLGAGAAEVAGALPGLRRDVDTLEDLRVLEDLGLLGSHTRAALDRNGVPGRSPDPPIRGVASVTRRE